MSAYFDDLRVGEVFDLGDYRFDAAEIKAFAALYDPQPFHLDEEAARASHFGALCASGWHTAAVWMKLVITHHQRASSDALAEGRIPAQLGPSPGFTDLKWIRPVYAGDRLRYRAEITKLTRSASKPDWGIVSMHSTADNQNGIRVFEFQGVVFWGGRPKA